MNLLNLLKKIIRPTNRTVILNYLIKHNNFKNYLEIGVRNPKKNFNKIKIKNKEGVDPNWLNNPSDGIKHSMTSDVFFSSIDLNKKYDLIFIDGLHIYEQAYKDIKNSLKHLSKKGIILIHDCNPLTEWHQRPLEEYDGTKTWNGTTWKAFVKLRCLKSNINMLTIDTDHGLGIIKNGTQKKYNKAPLEICLSWNYFEKNRIELLNLISVKKFYSNF